MLLFQLAICDSTGDLGLSDSQWEQSEGKNGGENEENMIEGMNGVGNNMEDGMAMKERRKEQRDNSESLVKEHQTSVYRK
jgi:hypothetical protein